MAPHAAAFFRTLHGKVTHRRDLQGFAAPALNELKSGWIEVTLKKSPPILLFPLFAAAALMLPLAGCAGNGKGLNADGQPLTPGSSSGTEALAADFASIQDNVFTPICSVCHSGAGAPQGLRLDAANSYNLLVGVPSTEVPSILRVKPGDPDNSYIIQKLEGHAAVGARMPLGGPYLPATTIAMIAQWITDGAQRSSTAAAAAPAAFAVAGSAPDSNEVLDEPPPQVLIAFNRELDTTRIDLNSARIEPVSAEGERTAAEAIPARVTVPAANSRALLVWPSSALPNGRYRVLLRTAGPFAVADLTGQSIGGGKPNEAGETLITTFEVEASP